MTPVPPVVPGSTGVIWVRGGLVDAATDVPTIGWDVGPAPAAPVPLEPDWLVGEGGGGLPRSQPVSKRAIAMKGKPSVAIGGMDWRGIDVSRVMVATNLEAVSKDVRHLDIRRDSSLRSVVHLVSC